MLARTSSSLSAPTTSGRQSHSLLVQGLVSRIASAICTKWRSSGGMTWKRIGGRSALLQPFGADRLEALCDVHERLLDAEALQRTRSDESNALRHAIHQLLRVFRPGKRAAVA